MIVVVHEHCIDDEDATFILDLDKLDRSDPEIKQYHAAVLAGMKENTDRNRTGGNVAFNYHSSDKKWKVARVKPPCKVDAISEIWEGVGPEPEENEK